MKRNFFIHPKDVGFFDCIQGSISPIYPLGKEIDYVNYKIEKYTDGQSVEFESVDCPISNSISISTILCIIKSTTTTPPPNPWPYYTASGLNLHRCRPYIELWLKKDKNPSRYYLNAGGRSLWGGFPTVNGIYRCFFLFNLEIEKMNPFDTFKIVTNYGTDAFTIDIIGNENSGTTAFSRNAISPLNPFVVNTYWKN